MGNTSSSGSLDKRVDVRGARHFILSAPPRSVPAASSGQLLANPSMDFGSQYRSSPSLSRGAAVLRNEPLCRDYLDPHGPNRSFGPHIGDLPPTDLSSRWGPDIGLASTISGTSNMYRLQTRLMWWHRARGCKRIPTTCGDASRRGSRASS